MSAPADQRSLAPDAERRAVAALRAAGCEDAVTDAALLVADAVARDTGAATPGGLSAHGSTLLEESVARRAGREPLGYIRGRVVFCGLEILVDPRVFIPRPETEVLVRAALGLPYGARVLEPCTGSGAIALALKHARPDLEVTATDRSGAALDVAGANAARLGLNLTLAQADGIAAAPGGPYDAVVSNPPYVPRAEAGAGSLPPELEYREPPEAFWGGSDGLCFYRRFSAELDGVDHVAFEVGDGQAADVDRVLQEAGFQPARPHRAASGAIRALSTTRRAA